MSPAHSSAAGGRPEQAPPPSYAQYISRVAAVLDFDSAVCDWLAEHDIGPQGLLVINSALDSDPSAWIAVFMRAGLMMSEAIELRDLVVEGVIEAVELQRLSTWVTQDIEP